MSEEERQFPVLWQGSREYIDKLKELNCPRKVPWAFIEQYHDECLNNHDQTPQRLAERGGLGPEEIVAVVNGAHSRKLRMLYWHMEPEKTVPLLKQIINDWWLKTNPTEVPKQLVKEMISQARNSHLQERLLIAANNTNIEGDSQMFNTVATLLKDLADECERLQSELDAQKEKLK